MTDTLLGKNKDTLLGNTNVTFSQTEFVGCQISIPHTQGGEVVARLNLRPDQETDLMYWLRARHDRRQGADKGNLNDYLDKMTMRIAVEVDFIS